jgi:hypothetical protein
MRLLVRDNRDFENRVWAFERPDRFRAAKPVTLSSTAQRSMPTLSGKNGLSHAVSRSPCIRRLKSVGTVSARSQGTCATQRCAATASPTMFSFCPEARALSIWSFNGEESGGNIRHKTLRALR